MKAQPSNYHLYNKTLKELARKNRKSMTKSAKYVWNNFLRKEQMLGYKFRRERAILNFIVDFVCLELMLIIEIDGVSHQSLENEERDQLRDATLKKVGFTTLRFSDDQILIDPKSVKEEIENWIINK